MTPADGKSFEFRERLEKSLDNNHKEKLRFDFHRSGVFYFLDYCFAV